MPSESLVNPKGVHSDYPVFDPATGKRKSVLETTDYLPRLVSIGKWCLIGGLVVVGVGLPIITHYRSAWILPHRYYNRPATHLGRVQGEVERYKAVTAGAGSNTPSPF